MPPIPELTEPLTDGQICVRMAAERDIPEILIAYQDDRKLHLRLGQERPPSGAQLGTQCEEAPAELAAGTHAQLTITDAGADDCVGQVAVHHIDWDNARAELGIWVAPQLRNQGVARRALRLVAPWLFAAWGLRRLALLTEPDNEPLLHAAHSAGFVYEGVLRAYTRERGARVDNAVLSLLPKDLER
jgi:RimJ/RimL family protein N-acetyltransferase